MKLIEKTTDYNGVPVDIVYIPNNKPHLEEYAQAYLAEGHSKEEVEGFVTGLLWSPLYLGEPVPEENK